MDRNGKSILQKLHMNKKRLGQSIMSGRFLLPEFSFHFVKTGHLSQEDRHWGPNSPQLDVLREKACENSRV